MTVTSVRIVERDAATQPKNLSHSAFAQTRRERIFAGEFEKILVVENAVSLVQLERSNRFVRLQHIGQDVNLDMVARLKGIPFRWKIHEIRRVVDGDIETVKGLRK